MSLGAPSSDPTENVPINPIIPKSERRAAIDRLICAEAIYGRDANPLFEQVGQLDGIEIMERRDYQRDSRYKCAWFAFKDENWWTSEDDLTLEFWDDTENFLKARGYFKVDQPEDGDIVLYRRGKDSNRPSTVAHFGIFEKGQVVSKFNQGHIYRHDISMVPNMFGENLIFMRKTK